MIWTPVRVRITIMATLLLYTLLIGLLRVVQPARKFDYRFTAIMTNGVVLFVQLYAFYREYDKLVSHRVTAVRLLQALSFLAAIILLGLDVYHKALTSLLMVALLCSAYDILRVLSRANDPQDQERRQLWAAQTAIDS
jgi:hypothetical protein